MPMLRIRCSHSFLYALLRLQSAADSLAEERKRQEAFLAHRKSCFDATRPMGWQRRNINDSNFNSEKSVESRSVCYPHYYDARWRENEESKQGCGMGCHPHQTLIIEAKPTIGMEPILSAPLSYRQHIALRTCSECIYHDPDSPFVCVVSP